MNNMSRLQHLTLLFSISAILFASCEGGKMKPDVSKIKVKLETIRFEKDFFQIDTSRFDESMQMLREKHHNFMNDFLE